MEGFSGEITIREGGSEIPARIEVTAHAHPIPAHDGVFLWTGQRMFKLTAEEADVLGALLKAAAATWRRTAKQ